MRRTSVFGVYDGGTYGALERVSERAADPPPFEPRQRLWHIVAKRAVLAAGAIERPLVFANNDRPGIMLAGAVRTYVNRFAVAPGTRVAVFADNDDAWRTAADLLDAGVTVAAMIDARAVPSSPLRDRLAEAGVPVHSGAVVETAHGGKHVSGVTVRDASGKATRLDCDLVAMSGGWSPAVHLTTHLGGRPVWDARLSALVPGTLPPGTSVAGAAAGQFALRACLADGARARHRGGGGMRVQGIGQGRSGNSRRRRPPRRSGR